MKGRFALIVAVLVIMGFVPAQAALTCTISGTGSRDVIRGTLARDVICLKGGPDYGHGRGGGDVVYGSTGNDTAVGGSGADHLKGGPNNDDLFGVDNAPGDVLDGGLGFDNCYGDRGDVMVRCEHRVFV